jgi:hypothetical protein
VLTVGRQVGEVPAPRDVAGRGHLVACHQVGDDGPAPSIVELAASA